MEAYIGGAWREITGGDAFVGGAWRVLKHAEAYVDGQWRTVANFTSGGGTISLTTSPSTATGSGRLATVSTSNVTATPSGGMAPYTYAWVKQSGGDISAVSPSSAVTQFRATDMDVDETRNAVFRCTCTDNLGSSATADVSVSITRIEPIDPGGNQ